MNPIGALSSDPFFRHLGATLLHFLWQGTLIAALYAALRWIFPRSKGARARYCAGCAALAAMLILPTATFWRSSMEETVLLRAAAGRQTGWSGPSPAVPASLTPARPVISAQLSRALQESARALEPWLVLLWIGGLPLLSLRLLMGWAAVERFRRRQAAEAPAALQETFQSLVRRLRVARPVRLLESAAVRVPTAFGVVKPVVLMPLSSLSGFSPEQIESLLAHELAHIRRHDYLVNLLQTAVETLLFYHPAVWWVSNSVRAERENCCDDLAVAVTGDARGYARALLRLEESRAAAPQVALAASGGLMGRRIARLLPVSAGEEIGSRLGALLLAFAALVTLGAASVTTSPPTDLFQASEPAVAATRPSAPTAPALARATRAARAQATAVAHSPAAPVPAVIQIKPEANVASARPVLDSEDSGILPADQFEAFRRHGVSAGFVASIESLGYSRASAHTLVALRIHGVSADFVRESNEVFGERLSLDSCIDLRIHGISPAYVREMAGVLGKLSLDEARSLRIHGVTPDYARQLSEAAGGRLSPHEAVTMRNHGVDPRAAAEFLRLGLAKPSLSELLTARDHGVSVEYARGITQAGPGIADLEVLVTLRDHGVTPDFVQALGKLGFPKLSSDEAIALRDHGVTADFVRGLQELGYTSLTVDDLVALRNHGVTPDFVRKANAAARSRLSTDELIDRYERREP